MLTFDRFEPDAVLGTVTFTVNEEHLAAWRALFLEEVESEDALPP